VGDGRWIKKYCCTLKVRQHILASGHVPPFFLGGQRA